MLANCESPLVTHLEVDNEEADGLCWWLWCLYDISSSAGFFSPANTLLDSLGAALIFIDIYIYIENIEKKMQHRIIECRSWTFGSNNQGECGPLKLCATDLKRSQTALFTPMEKRQYDRNREKGKKLSLTIQSEVNRSKIQIRAAAPGERQKEKVYRMANGPVLDYLAES